MKYKYNKAYHSRIHGYLLNSKEYYLIRSRLAFKRYFSQIPFIFNRKIFEFGGGLGQNVYPLKKNAIIYDISDFALNFAKKKGINATKNIDDIKDNSFDIALSSHTLEHLDNPLENLKLLRAKIKKNGMLILIIPKENREQTERNNYHLYAWTSGTIENLLNRAGFKVLSTRLFYGTAYYKLRFLAKLSFNLYCLCTAIAGGLFNLSEYMIIAKRK